MAECPACRKPFDALAVRPKPLTCGHSLCLGCILHIPNGWCPQCSEEQESQSTAITSDQELDLAELSGTARGEQQEEKAATLARVQHGGVRRMRLVRCDCDPAWTLDILRSAAPTLEELEVLFPREEHLRVVHAIPGLRRLVLECGRNGAVPDAQPPLLPTLATSRLEYLRVNGRLPRPTLVSLLQAHSASLSAMLLEVDTLPTADWSSRYPGLDALVAQCVPRVARVVLQRGRCGALHDTTACGAQVAAVRRALPGATVQCDKCTNARPYKYYNVSPSMIY